MWILDERSTSKQVQVKESIKKKLMEIPLTRFSENPETIHVRFVRGSILPSNPQGVYDRKIVKIITLYTALNSGPVSFKVPQNILEIFTAMHHIVTTPTF